MNAKNHRYGLGPLLTFNSGPKVAVLHAKTTNEGWVASRLVSVMLKFLFSMHETTDEGWDQ